MTTLRLVALLLVAIVSAPAAAPVRVPVIVELFTSEGCSSCPPADRVLRELVATQPVETALIIGLGEHVDYWDRLGWKDPFSAAQFSQRQSDYAARAGGDNIYTPQMIVDGGAPFVGSDRAAALAAVRKGAAQPMRQIRLAWAAASPDRLEIDVPAGGEPHASRVMLAIAESGLSTHVTRGENNGHTLVHDGVVRRLVELGQTNAGGEYHGVVPVPLDRSWSRGASQAVVFTQRPGGPITAAAVIAVQ